jgi:hypothetical protein
VNVELEVACVDDPAKTGSALAIVFLRLAFLGIVKQMPTLG